MAHILRVSPRMESVRALVAEANPTVRESLARALEDRGVAATAVDDADAAFACFGTDQFDLIILDVDLPGIEAAEVMRRLSVLDPPPLTIALTPGQDGPLSGYDGKLVAMSVSAEWDLETLADILSRSARDYRGRAH